MIWISNSKIKRFFFIQPLLEARAKQCTKFYWFFGVWENFAFAFEFYWPLIDEKNLWKIFRKTLNPLCELRVQRPRKCGTGSRQGQNERNTCSSQITVFITVISGFGQVGQLGSYPWTLERTPLESYSKFLGCLKENRLNETCVNLESKDLENSDLVHARAKTPNATRVHHKLQFLSL